MKKGVACLVAFLALGGCPTQPANNTPQPKPGPPPKPFVWLAADVNCRGSITRAQWLICDNQKLGELHRRLAYQWDAERQGAWPERLAVLRAQQRALIAERDSCEDAACIATAYRRYLPPEAKPTPIGKPKPPVRKPPKKWVRKPGKRPLPPRPDRDGDGPACTAEAGAAEALRLSRRCDAVTVGQDWSCRPTRSCATLRRNIAKGCNETYRKPGFCERR